jgi:hypothetical protein
MIDIIQTTIAAALQRGCCNITAIRRLIYRKWHITIGDDAISRRLHNIKHK